MAYDIWTRASELAQSGDLNPTDVLFALQEDGFPDAASTLSGQDSLERLYKMCDAAKIAKRKPLSPRGIPGQR